jgi:hypothetical protein
MYKNPDNPELERDINARMELNGSQELSMAEYVLDKLFNAVPQDQKSLSAQLLLVSKIKQNCLKSAYNESNLLGKDAVVKLAKMLVEVILRNIKNRFDGWELVIDTIAKETLQLTQDAKNE